MNYAQVTTATNTTQIFELMDDLRRAFETYVNEQAAEKKEVGYIDAFMGVHNFHKLIIMDIADRGALQGEAKKLFYQMAADTFQKAINDLKEKVK